MARKYDKTVLAHLKNDSYEKTEQGTRITYKPIPGDDRQGILDPLVYKSIRPPSLLMKLIPKKKHHTMEDSLAGMRRIFNGIKSTSITSSTTKIQNLHVDYHGLSIPIRIYTPGVLEPGQVLPVLYYIHGGGFFAGSPDVVEEAVKFFCESYPCIVVSPTYRLAPENPYPASHNDCFAVLEWIYENIGTYSGDKKKIFISGDSAGGNLAIYCSMKDKENKTGMIKAQALYYPTVNMCGKEDEYFKAGKQNYKIKKKYQHIVFKILDEMNRNPKDNPLSPITLLGKDADVNHPFLSPYWGDLEGMPPTILLFGEYDFLFAECKAFAKKLNNAHIPIKTIIYKGMLHAFLDNMGINPQAEDSVLEVIDFVKKFI